MNSQIFAARVWQHDGGSVTLHHPAQDAGNCVQQIVELQVGDDLVG